MDFNLPMIFADVVSAVSVALMLLILKTQSKHDQRIQHIEDDLYVKAGNPTSMPLTKQVYNLQQDVSQIRQSCERLDESLKDLNETMKGVCSQINLKKLM